MAEQQPDDAPWEAQRAPEETPAETPQGTMAGIPAAEPVRLDVDPSRPGGELSGPPPERSHD